MLPAQVEYWKLRENQRHNVASETLGFVTLGETVRHNKQAEQVSWSDLSERTRHNKQTEQVSWSDLSEKARHNRQSEGLSWADLSERTRHNKATERLSGEVNQINWVNATTRRRELTEAVRHNRVGEGIAQYQAASQRIGAYAAESQAEVAWENAALRASELEQTKVRDQNNYSVGLFNAITNRTSAEAQAETNRRSVNSQIERNRAEIQYGAYETYVTDTANSAANLAKGIGEIIPF